MARRRPTQFTEREAKKYAEERGRVIEALSDRPLTFAAAVKRLPVDRSGFLIWDEETERYIPAILVEDMSRHIQEISESWDSAAEQGWDGPGWYFWDETQAFCHGPFKSLGEARVALNQYAKELG